MTRALDLLIFNARPWSRGAASTVRTPSAWRRARSSRWGRGVHWTTCAVPRRGGSTRVAEPSPRDLRRPSSSGGVGPIAPRSPPGRIAQPARGD